MFSLEDGRYIIGFDDGYQLGKTANYVFDNGVHMIGSVEPTLKEIADRQEFYNQMLTVIREEMQSQGMKLVGTLLAGSGVVNIPISQKENVSREVELPELCDVLPEKLQGILDFIG